LAAWGGFYRAHDVPLWAIGLFGYIKYTIFGATFKEKVGEIMRNYGNFLQLSSSAEEQLLFQHSPQTTDGWITLAKKDPGIKRFYQRHYRPEELAGALSKWTGEDIYYSQNSFFKPQRRTDNIRQLRSLYVDLDVYNIGAKPEWVLGKLEMEYFRKSIPEPNMVIFSGRGLVLIWNIEPVPYMAMPLWKALETRFMETLKDLGADPKASDPARIFRLAGTINSKSQAVVKTEYRHGYRYDIQELKFDYLPELKTEAQQAKRKGRKSKVVRMFNTFTLHLSRAKDVAKLVELRQGHVTNYREYICFLFRYFTCCYTSDPEQALEETLDLNSEFADPLSDREVISATKKAERAWAAKSDAKANEFARSVGYPGAGYFLTNRKIIDWLDITLDEQKEMSTIIGAEEKRRRNRLAKEKSRRAQGIRPMEEYNQERKKTVETKIQTLQRLMKKNPSWSNVKLAKEMGVSEGYIRKLKKQLS
jgi:hypothetical protein